MRINWAKSLRKFHFWGAVLTAIPIFIIIVSGILLQMKKDSDWVQPPTQKMSKEPPSISAQEILAAAQQVPEAEINGWEDVKLFDVRVGKGTTKVRAKNRWEVQVDHQTGDVVQVAYRRSDLIEEIHDGSFFNKIVKSWIFFPAGVVLLILWLTGGYMIVYPYWKKAQRNTKRAKTSRPIPA
ncbi:MAG: PepSY-associated TM helix domain-containing protein [Chloroflexota bacterium]